MPLPLAIPAGLAALGAWASAVAVPVLRAEVTRQLHRHRSDIESWALSNALEAMGLPIDLDGPITPQTFTQAVNKGLLAGSGVEFTNVFDKMRVQDDLKRIALKKAAEELGVKVGAWTVDALRDALKVWMAERVRVQIESQSGEFIQEARDLLAIVSIIRSVYGVTKAGDPLVPKPPVPLKMDRASILNRERQARYRASHKRHWEPA